MTTFPVPTPVVYPNIPFYFSVVTDTATRDCPTPTVNFKDIRCVNAQGDADPASVKCGEDKECDSTTCAEVDATWCSMGLPFSIYDSDNSWLANCLYNDTSSACEDIEAVDLTRPSAFDRTDTSVNRWYVSDPSYAWTVNYTCDESVDEVGDDNGKYMNIWCEDGTATDPLTFHNYEVYCREGTHGRVNEDYTEKLVPNCTYTTCEDMEAYVCPHPIDLFALNADGGLDWKGTCVLATVGDTNCSQSGTTGGPAPTWANITRPKEKGDDADTKYWYVFGDYNDKVMYTCSADDNPSDDDYINVLCDPTFTGKVDTGVTVACLAAKEATELFDATPVSHTSVDCSMDSCDSFDPSVCKEAFDLFDGSEDPPVYKDTCSQNEDASKCVSGSSGAYGLAFIGMASLLVGFLM